MYARVRESVWRICQRCPRNQPRKIHQLRAPPLPLLPRRDIRPKSKERAISTKSIPRNRFSRRFLSARSASTNNDSHGDKKRKPDDPLLPAYPSHSHALLQGSAAAGSAKRDCKKKYFRRRTLPLPLSAFPFPSPLSNCAFRSGIGARARGTIKIRAADILTNGTE